MPTRPLLALGTLNCLMFILRSEENQILNEWLGVEKKKEKLFVPGVFPVDLWRVGRPRFIHA